VARRPPAGGGTGFHPELTGREEHLPQRGILGMKKTKSPAKFDEIVAFAEIEKFRIPR